MMLKENALEIYDLGVGSIAPLPLHPSFCTLSQWHSGLPLGLIPVLGLFLGQLHQLLGRNSEGRS